MNKAKRHLFTAPAVIKSAVASAPAHIPEIPKSTFISHVVGAASPEIRNITTSDLLSETASLYPEKRAVVSASQDVSLSYAQLDRKASDFATNLYDFGYRRGDRIGICATNIWEYLVMQMGMARLGAILVPLNPSFTLKQHAKALDRTQAKGLIIQSHLPAGRNKPHTDTSDIIHKLTESLPGMSVFSLAHHDHGQNASLQDHQGRVFDAGSLLEETSHRSFLTDPNDIVHMQFTSGTTSDPKISSLTHRNINNNALLIGHRLGFSATESHHPTGQDHLCTPVPMYHCFGLVLSNLLCVGTGAAVVLPSESFDPAAALTAIDKYDCTAINGVPTMFAAQLDQHQLIPKGGFKYLRTGIAAGAVVPPALMTRLINEMGLKELSICYGMTETAPVTFMTRPDDSFEHRTSTVGRVLPGSECMIVKPDSKTLTPVPVGEKGEIVTAGYSLQRYYYQDRAKTEKDMVHDRNGKRWMRSGDEGYLDEGGYLTVTGRIKDMIIRGGENINPQEIENVLFEHPSVNQASVIGVPDEKYGEQIAVFIVRESGHNATADELREYLREHLGHYLVPKYFWFITVFPKTTSGKIRKVDLRVDATKLLEQGNYE